MDVAKIRRQRGKFAPIILIVDQDANQIQLIEKALAGADVTILTAGTGRETLEKVQSDKPGIVILDLTVPDMDGYEVFRAIREDPETCATVVIVTHPHPSDADILRAFGLNSDCFLGKPIDRVGLRTFIDRLLQIR